MSQINYQVGEDANIITLEIQVGSAAAWGGFVFQPIVGTDPLKYKLLAQSHLLGSNTVFPKTSLGLSQDLRGIDILVEIRADFRVATHIDGADLKKKDIVLFNALVIKYTLNGGNDNTVFFSYDSNDTIYFSPDGEIVYVQKTISFK